MRQVIAFQLCAFLQDKTVIYLSGPEGAKEEDLIRAASALHSRCVSFGFNGITTNAVGGKVELKTDVGTAKNIEQTIKFLAMFSGKRVSLHQVYKLSPAEQQQYKQPEADFSKAQSPPGTKWFSSNIGLGGFAGYPVFLLKSEPIAQKLSGKLKREAGSMPFYELASNVGRNLRSGIEPNISGVYLVMDDLVMPVPGTIDFDYFEAGKKTGKTRYSLPNELVAVDCILQNPMPFGLIVAK